MVGFHIYSPPRCKRKSCLTVLSVLVNWGFFPPALRWLILTPDMKTDKKWHKKYIIHGKNIFTHLVESKYTVKMIQLVCSIHFELFPQPNCCDGLGILNHQNRTKNSNKMLVQIHFVSTNNWICFWRSEKIQIILSICLDSKKEKSILQWFIVCYKTNISSFITICSWSAFFLSQEWAQEHLQTFPLQI